MGVQSFRRASLDDLRLLLACHHAVQDDPHPSYLSAAASSGADRLSVVLELDLRCRDGLNTADVRSAWIVPWVPTFPGVISCGVYLFASNPGRCTGLKAESVVQANVHTGPTTSSQAHAHHVAHLNSAHVVLPLGDGGLPASYHAAATELPLVGVRSTTRLNELIRRRRENGRPAGRSERGLLSA